MDNVKIYITGAAGVGKTTLANRISERLNIPFISTSAKESIWPRFGFKNYKDAHTICTLNRDIALEYQSEVYKQRQSALKGLSWVTDRSPIDNLTYLMFQASHHNIPDKVIAKFLDHFKKSLQDCNLIIYLRYTNNVVLEDDGFRVLNCLHQVTIDALVGRAIGILGLEKDSRLVEIPAFTDLTIDMFINDLPQIIGARLKK